MSAHGYRRILLKLSGEVLMGDQSFGIDPDTVARVAEEVKAAKDTGLATVPRDRRRQYLPRYGRARPRAWTGRRPTIWACWQR